MFRPAYSRSGDGQVDYHDFRLFAGRFGTMRGDPGFDPNPDCNHDDRVDFTDFLRFVRQFGR
jgi:hypothetical protein